MKKTYTKPTITEHGDIQAVTRGFGGGSSDAIFGRRSGGGGGGHTGS
jgi:hypothetical protein